MTGVERIARVSVGIGVLVLGGLLVLHSGSIDQHRPSAPPNNALTGTAPTGTAPQGGESLANLDTNLSTIHFGSVEVGKVSQQTLILSNRDPHTDLVIDNLFLDEHDSLYFSLDKEPPLRLEAGQQIAIEVTFSPTKNGELPGRLIINHNGNYGTKLIDLDGVGIDRNSNEPLIAAAVPGDYPFGKSTLEGFTGGKPTSLQFGLDGKLYAALLDGSINVMEVERSSEIPTR